MHHRLIEEILAFTKSTSATDTGNSVSYPGERTLKTRQENEEEGIPVNEKIWKQVKNM